MFCYLIVRVLRGRGYFQTLRERFGVLPASWQKTAPGAIWFHAVSVGEVLAAIPLIEELRNDAPRAAFYLSTTTLAGRATANTRAASLTDGIFYAPLDLVWFIRRVLRRLKPSLLVVIETEIWPNLFREAARIGCGVVIVNGRISDRALPRYRRFSWLFGPVLGLCDRVITQSDEMRARYIAAGAPEAKVSTGGNLKYDFVPQVVPQDSPVRQFVAARTAPLWIAASTSADGAVDEEDFVLAAQARLKGWRLIVAPRKPERFNAVADKLAASGLRFTRRTRLDDPAADVLLLDSIGELSGLFEFAKVVFMGGTLANRGGHNVLEPALFGKPIVVGPHLENFRDIEAEFETGHAFLRIAQGEELAAAVARAADDPGLGERALHVAQSQTGAAKRTAAALMEIYRSSYPSERCAQPGWAILWLFSQLWRWGSALDRRRKASRSRSLPVPVVSIGNITAGGTGKTPLTIELLREFQSASPGLLTRGHGRSTNDIVLLPNGDEEFPITLTGDEAQLYVRALKVPIGIGGDRYETGTRLLGAADVKLLFLDDGYQHLQLGRQFDLVAVDALSPFGGGHLLPLGRLREPLEGLARADAFLITREREASNVDAIESVLRRYNPRAPIFRSRTVPKCWKNHAGETFALDAVPHDNAVAFCGLGNPETFWRTLDRLGFQPLARLDYGDHHRYTPVEIRRLRQHALDLGVDTLLTTAKDSVNLCEDVVETLAPLRLYWLEIELEIDRREELVRLIASRIGAG